jgi:DivIVA domain-containing protein
MTWFFALVVVALLGATAVVAAGRGGSMTEVHDDRPDAFVPVDRPLVGADLRTVRFSTALRGYRMAEVDALLERLAQQLAEAERGRGDARSRPTEQPPP